MSSQQPEQQQPLRTGEKTDCSGHLLGLTQVLNNSTTATAKGTLQCAVTIAPLDPGTGEGLRTQGTVNLISNHDRLIAQLRTETLDLWSEFLSEFRTS